MHAFNGRVVLSILRESMDLFYNVVQHMVEGTVTVGTVIVKSIQMKRKKKKKIY